MGPWNTERWLRVLIRMGLRPDLHIVNNQIVAKPQLDVLCFDCGGMFQVPYGTKDITKQCPKCQGK